MTLLHTIFVLGAAFLAIFCEGSFQGVRRLLGAQIDLLPALMVYASLSTGLTTVALLAFLGGLWFDSLSANPLGVSVLPMFVIGLAIFLKRDLILRDQRVAQLALGLVASAAAPPLTLLVLLTTGHTPLLGWGSIWQWIVMAAGGAMATPVCFEVFAWLHRTLVHGAAIQSSFRSDREIRRGR
jgi:cell shape-determining protein MreD